MANQTKKGQLKKLYNQIFEKVSPTGDSIFVFSIEAGLGKTKTMVKALNDLYMKDPTNKSLVVTKYKDEAKRLESMLKGIAIAIDSNNKDIDTEIIIKKPVVIITHSRYQMLCQERTKSKYKRYTTGRKNLIIDEQLHLMETASISLDSYLAARNTIKLLDHRLEPAFDAAFSQIYKTLLEYTKECNSKQNKVSQYKMKKQNEIRKRIKKAANCTKYHVLKKKAKNEYEEINSSYSDLFEIIQNMTTILRTSYIHDNIGIHCLKNNVDYVLLENNILLDASAPIQALYEYLPKMHIVPMDRIVSHKNWTLHVLPVNTSKSAKRKKDDFYEKSCDLIKKICTDRHDKLLVVGSAEDVGGTSEPGELPKILPSGKQENGSIIDYANFYALLGKNDWYDYNKCLIIHTPYCPTYYYPLLFKFVDPKCIIKDSDLILNWTDNGLKQHYGFTNHAILDSLRESDLATLTYQAIKRINRNNRLKADIYLATNNMNIVEIVKEHLPGIKCKKQKEKKRPYNRRDVSPYIEKLKTLLNELAQGHHINAEYEHKPGYYPKKWCMGKIGLKDYTHFSRYTKTLKSQMKRLGIYQDKYNLIVKGFTENY